MKLSNLYKIELTDNTIQLENNLISKIIDINPDRKFVITIAIESCLLLYPADIWFVLEEKLIALPSMNKEARTLQRRMIGHKIDYFLAESGQIKLPQILVEQAGLKENLVLFSVGNKIEIWDEQAFNENIEVVDCQKRYRLYESLNEIVDSTARDTLKQVFS